MKSLLPARIAFVYMLKKKKKKKNGVSLLRDKKIEHSLFTGTKHCSPPPTPTPHSSFQVPSPLSCAVNLVTSSHVTFTCSALARDDAILFPLVS